MDTTSRDRTKPLDGQAERVDPPEGSLAGVRRLHDEVDARARALAAHHGPRLHCARGCSGCCVDDVTVFDVEAELIRVEHVALLREGTPHPRGACAFLDAAGACRIYDARPYVCRTQGLPLRWLETDEQGETLELRDICPLNDDGPPLEELPANRCWSLGPVEGRLAELQRRWGGGRMDRVALRNLFRAAHEDPPTP